MEMKEEMSINAAVDGEELEDKVRIICEVGSLKLVCGAHISHDANHALSKACEMYSRFYSFRACGNILTVKLNK